MSIYLKLNELQQQINNISTRGVTTAGTVILSSGLNASYVSASTGVSGALFYAGRLSGSAVSSSFIYAGQLTGSAVSSSLIYAGQLTGSAISGALVYANSLTASGLLVSQDNLQIGTNGKGIDFSAITNATNSSGVSITSEVLDHYEEGTWTPQISGSSTAGTTTYAAGGQVGRYTRIGRIIFLNGYVSWTNNAGGAGNLLIGNLPYTVTNSDAESTGFLQYSSLSVPFSSIAFAQSVKNTTYLKVLSISTGSANSTALALDTAATCAFSLTYEIA